MPQQTDIISYAIGLGGHAIDKTVGIAGDAVGFGVTGAQAGMLAGAKGVGAAIVAATSVEGESYNVEPMQAELEPAIEVSEESPFAQMLQGVDLGGMEMVVPEFQAPSGIAELDGVSSGVYAMTPAVREAQQAAFMSA